MKLTPKVFTIPGDGPGLATPEIEERIARGLGYESAADWISKAKQPLDVYTRLMKKEAERLRLDDLRARLENCGGDWPTRLLRKLHHYGLVGQEQPPVWALELIASEIEAELDKPVR